MRIIPAIIAMMLCMAAFISQNDALAQDTDLSREQKNFLMDNSRFDELVSNEQANKYFNECMAIAGPDPDAVPESHLATCACMSANFKEVVTNRDLEYLTEMSDNGNEARKKILIYVQAPCIEFAAREIIYNNCAANRAFWNVVDNLEDMCQCVSDRMGNYLSIYGVDLFSKLQYTRSEDFEEPLKAIMDSWDYIKKHKIIEDKCRGYFVQNPYIGDDEDWGQYDDWDQYINDNYWNDSNDNW
jgi:hypothetical protein